MVELRYPLSSLVFDYLRGIVGLGIAVVIVSAVGTDTPVFWVIAGLAVLFLIWLGYTALRHLSRVRFDEDGLRIEPWPKRFIAWNELCWTARMKPLMRPMSCCGNRPLGPIT